MYRPDLSKTLVTVALLSVGGLVIGWSRLQAAGPGAATKPADVLPAKVSFNAHIRPIFSNSCFA